MGPIQIDGPASLPYDIDLGPLILSDYYYRTADEIVLAGGAPPASDNILYVQYLLLLSIPLKTPQRRRFLSFDFTKCISRNWDGVTPFKLRFCSIKQGIQLTLRSLRIESTVPNQIPPLASASTIIFLSRLAKDTDYESSTRVSSCNCHVQQT